MVSSRRKFIKRTGLLSAGIGLMGLNACKSKPAEAGTTKFQEKELFFKISLAQWSLHRALKSGKMNHFDFITQARSVYGVDGVEYVNQFFADKATDKNFLEEMNHRAIDSDVKQILIMIDGEGQLASVDEKNRLKAVENHYKWVEAAKHLGCHSIRVNAAGNGDIEEVKNAGIDGLGRLSTFAQDYEINVIVENHGGYSSDGKWLSSLIDQVNMENCGTLPDFGNFCVKYGENGCQNEYDRYMGVEELMPFAKAVSAKSHDFDENGNEIHTDFKKMLQIVKDHQYTGFVGIEYEGSQLGEKEGVLATKDLMIRIGKELS